MVHALEKAAHEHRVRFSKLHERRFEVVAGVYASLVQAEQALKRAAALDTPGMQELRDDYRSFADRANEFFINFAERRIFFPEDVGARFDGYWQKMKDAGYVVRSRLDSKPKDWLERYGKLVGEDLPPLKKGIEAECRRLLGAPEFPI